MVASNLDISENPDATLTVSNLSNGSFCVKISAPTEYIGAYYQDIDNHSLSTSLLDTGPVCIVAPVIFGVSNVGGVLTITPGLWLFDGAEQRPDVSYQWARNGTPIIGEDGPSFIVSQADQGAEITVVEQAIGSAVTKFADSNAISILVPGSLSVTFASTGTISNTGMGPYAIQNMALGATHSARVIFAVIGYGCDGNTGLTGVTIGGVPATQVVSITSNKFSNIGIWQAAVPFGTMADVSISMGSDFRGVHVSLFRVIGGTAGVSSSDSTPKQFPQDLTLEAPSGSVVIAGIAVRNAPGGSVTWAGLSENSSGFSWNNLLVSAASQEVTTTLTPKPITVTPPTGPQETCAAAVVINQI